MYLVEGARIAIKSLTLEFADPTTSRVAGAAESGIEDSLTLNR